MSEDQERRVQLGDPSLTLWERTPSAMLWLLLLK
jgi:hypothetical protein